MIYSTTISLHCYSFLKPESYLRWYIVIFITFIHFYLLVASIINSTFQFCYFNVVSRNISHRGIVDFPDFFANKFSVSIMLHCNDCLLLTCEHHDNIKVLLHTKLPLF